MNAIQSFCKMKINVAVTGASGAIYARLLIDRLLSVPEVESIRVILSENGNAILLSEIGENSLPRHDKISYANNRDFYQSIASGSGGDDAMVIVPCSVGMMSRVACGVSDDLITRGADVMLKERRKLILIVRETPLNLIHLQNMVTLTTAGAIIIPACPSFYTHPETIEELCGTVINVVLRQLGITVKEQWPPKQ